MRAVRQPAVEVRLADGRRLTYCCTVSCCTWRIIARNSSIEGRRLLTSSEEQDNTNPEEPPSVFQLPAGQPQWAFSGRLFGISGILAGGAKLLAILASVARLNHVPFELVARHAPGLDRLPLVKSRESGATASPSVFPAPRDGWFAGHRNLCGGSGGDADTVTGFFETTCGVVGDSSEIPVTPGRGFAM